MKQYSGLKDFSGQLNEYQEQASRTIPEVMINDKEKLIDNAVYGLCGELGELVDLIKKAKFQGHTLDKEKAVLELGDVLWYVSMMAKGLDVELEYVAIKNIEKLRKRYGEKFDPEKSVNRND